MLETQGHMPDFKERLKAQTAPASVPTRAQDSGPSSMLEPGTGHAASTHNRRHEVDMVRIHYGTDSKIALPYAYLAAMDMPEPGKLVLEFASRIVTIEGVRLETLMSEIEARHAAIIRASDNPTFDGGKEAVILSVTVKKLE